MKKSILFDSLKNTPPFETLIRFSHSLTRRIWISSSLHQVFFKAQIISICEKTRKIDIIIEPIPPLNSVDLSKLGSEIVHSIFESPDPPNNESSPDMVNMDCLNEAELLQNLLVRYQEKLIYTYIGKLHK